MFMNPFPEPSPHPLKADDFEPRYVRAHLLSGLCADYAHSVQLLVAGVLAREDPYRGGNGEALLAITAAREVMRTATAVIKTSEMDEFFASDIREKLDELRSTHENLKKARDVIAHVDEYVESRGKDPDQWFDTTNRFGSDAWVFRIGNKLDIDMVQLAADVNDLADAVKKSALLWGLIEAKLDGPSAIVKGLMDRGIYVSLKVSGEVGELSILETTPEEADITIEL